TAAAGDGGPEPGRPVRGARLRWLVAGRKAGGMAGHLAWTLGAGRGRFGRGRREPDRRPGSRGAWGGVGGAGPSDRGGPGSARNRSRNGGWPGLAEWRRERVARCRARRVCVVAGGRKPVAC